MKALLVVPIVFVLCCAGFLAYNSQETSGELVTLSDSEMTQRNGGSSLYTRYLARSSSGEFANCSISNCPPGRKTYIHATYGCSSCVSGERGVYRVRDYKTERTWCDNAGSTTENPFCHTRVYHPDYQIHCKQGGPICD